MKVFAQNPYYDDYDENKKFYSFLFRPSYSVQARELTQLQTILQTQIKRMGDHFFADGAMVIPGQMNFDTTIQYVKLQETTADITKLIGQDITGTESGVKATIITAINTEGSDPATLFVKYKNSGDTNESVSFIKGETLSGSEGLTVVNSDDALGTGSIAQIERGIYYVSGHFVLVDSQTIILDKYSNVPSYRIGLDVKEVIITPEEDSSLLDNAQGSYNYAAPGAHRYMIDLILKKVSLGTTNVENFIELGQIQTGKIVKQITNTEYSQLEKTLARRTYDESGDYTVRPFKISIKEHRSNDRGQWKSGTQYLRGDVIKNGDRCYTARTEGYSLSTGAGPTHTQGTQWESQSNSSGIKWEYTPIPKFNNGVYQAEGKITKLELVNGGSGFTEPPIVEISGGGGTGAKAIAVVSQGSIIQLLLENSGSGFTSNDIKVSFKGNGTGAIAKAYADFGEESKLAIGLESGKAYVQGYEIEKVGTSYVPVEKARQSEQASDRYVNSPIGNFVYVTNINGMPPCDTFEQVDIYNKLTENKQGQKVGEKIGTCRIRGIEWDSGNLHDSNGTYKLYLFDVNLNSDKDFSSDVKSFYFGRQNTQKSFSADIAPQLATIGGSVTTYSSYPNKGASNTLNGSNTSFMTDTRVGDYLKIGNSICQITSIVGQNEVTIDREITVDGEKVNLILTSVSEPQQISALYPLPNKCIKSVTDKDGSNKISYYTMEYLNGTSSSVSGSTCTLSLSVSNGVFGNEQENDNYIIIDQNTGKIVKPITISSGGQSNITFTLNQSLAQHNFSVMATVRKDNIGRKIKTVTRETIKFNNKEDATLSTISLGKADVFRIVAIKMSNNAWGEDGNYVTDISDRFEFNNGQTESYYGLSTISLKPSFNPPSGPFAVEFEYFRHSNGDYFTVDSYPEDISFSEIPLFNGTSLGDYLDFRPRIDDKGKTFSVTGSSYSSTVKRGQEITTDYSYYLGRKDKICLDFQGNFVDVSGVPSITPELPETPSLSMNLYNLDIKPYTFNADSTNCIVETIDNRRYTMRDIGKLEKRISNLEDYTTLSLLEQQTSNMKVEDADGLDRHKQGFIVDNFKDTTVSSKSDPSYNCSLVSDEGVCRPGFIQRNVSLVENEPSSRKLANYRAYGKVYTLDLDEEQPHVVLVDQPFASKTENINPFAVATFLGVIKCNPSSDDWFETKYLPDIINNVEGDYLQKKNSLEGTKWNSWQTTWTGTPTVTSKTQTVHWKGWDTRAQGRHVYEDFTYRTTYAQKEGQSRTGIKTSVTARIDYEEVGDRIVSTSEIPYMRSRYLMIKAQGLKPFTRFYPFFDDVAIDYWCTPCSRIEYIPTRGQFDDSSVAGADIGNKARIIETTKNSFWSEETDKTCLDIGDVITATSHQTGTPSRLSAVVVGRSYDGDTGKHYLYVTNIKEINGKPIDGEYFSDNGIKQTNSKVRSFIAGDLIEGSLSKAIGQVVSAEPNKNHRFEPLVTNYAGELFFLYWIPDGDKIEYTNIGDAKATAAFNFRCGERILSVNDNKDKDSLDSTSSSSTTYSAVGVINTRQKTINAVRNAQITEQSVSENRTVTNSWSQTTTSTINRDPLAETFLVDCKGGCFLSKVDVYFATKDTNLPVTLQIRTVENGYPTGKVLAFGEVIKRPEDINTSSNTVTYQNDKGVMVTENSYDTPTTFEFESPVYVEDGTEYAVVLLSDSTKYRVWIAEVGDNVPNQSVVISKQPFNGVLFKSQNGSTWSASQTQDLKFTIYRANFKTNTQANLQFRNVDLKSGYLNDNPFQTVKGSKLVRVWHNFHGQYNGSVVNITHDDLNLVDTKIKLLSGKITVAQNSNAVSGSGTKFTEELETGSVIYNESDEVVGVVKTITSDTKLVLVDNSTITLNSVPFKSVNSVNGIPFTSIVGTHTVSNVDMHSYVIEVNTAALATGYVGGRNFKASNNINYDVIQPNVTTQIFSDTMMSYTIDGVTGRSVDGSEIVNRNIPQIPVIPNDNNYLTNPLAIYSAENTNKTSLNLNVTFSSTNPALSPIIDSDRVSAVLINNTIDNPKETTVNVPTLDTVELITGDFAFAGGISEIKVGNQGSGYTTATVRIGAPNISGGRQAKAEAVISNQKITSIIVTDSGSGYTTPPSVTIDGGSSATATANMMYNQIINKNANAGKQLLRIDTGKYITIEGATTDDNNGTILVTNKTVTGTDESPIVVIETEKAFKSEDATGNTKISIRNLFTSEISPIGGSVTSKYITNAISFAGSCNFARIVFAANVPSQADIDVYYKAYQNGGSIGYNSIPWVKINSDNAIVKTDINVTKYTDVNYSIEQANSFDVLAVKIVFRSTNSSAVPSIRDLRIIACA